MSAVAHIEPEPMIWHEYANLFPLLEGEAFWSLALWKATRNAVRRILITMTR